MLKKNKLNLFGFILLSVGLLLQSHFATAAPLINDYNLKSGTVDQGSFRLFGSGFSSRYQPSDNSGAFYSLHSNYADVFENFASLQKSDIKPKFSKADGFKAIKLKADNANYFNTASGSAGITLKGHVGSTGFRNYYVYLKFFFPELPTSPMPIFESGAGNKKIALIYTPNTGSGASLSYTHGSTPITINNIFIQAGQWYAIEIKRVAEINHLTIQNAQGVQQTTSKWANGFSPDSSQPIYFGKGQVQGVTTYFDGYMRDLILRHKPLPSNEIGRALSLGKTIIKMRNQGSGLVSEHDNVILSERDDYLSLTVPRVALGNYDLSVLTPDGESNIVPFTVKGLEIERQAFVENFNDDHLVSSRWKATHKSWGGENGGVSQENVASDSDNGEVVITANGDQYTGEVHGTDRSCSNVTRTTRVGGVLVSRKYFGPGEFIIEATIPPLTGVASAFWLFHYEEAYPGHPLFDEMLAEGLHLSGDSNLGHYIVRNHEIDIEFPTALKTDPDQENVSFSNGRFNSWHGELRNWDVAEDDPAYWSEYTSSRVNHGKNITDGAFHQYKIKWMLDDGDPYVEFYIDGTLIKRIDTHVPFLPQKLEMGMWFPSGRIHWAGRGAPWDSQQMRIRRFEYIPEATVGASYVERGETYPVGCYRNIVSEMSRQIIGDFNGDGIQDTFNQAHTQNNVSSLSPQSGSMIGDFHITWSGTHPNIPQITDWSASQYGAYAGNFNANPGDELLLLKKASGSAISNAIVSWNGQLSADHTVFDFDADPDDFEVHTGHLTGDGYDEILLQRKWSGSTSYLLNNQGGLIQTFADGFLNLDWSAVSYSAQITSGNIVLTPLTPHKYAFEGQLYSFTPPTTANASSNVTYSATGMPGWMSLNTSTGEISGTPATGDIEQSHQIVITVSENNSQIVDHVLLSLNVDVVKSFAISQTGYTVYEATDGTLYLVSENGVDVYKVVDDNGTDVILKITTDEFNTANVGLAVNHHAFIKDFDNDGTLDLVLESLVITQPRIVIRHLAGNVHTITRGDTLTSTSEEEPIITQIGNFDSLTLGDDGVRGWAYDPSDPSSPINVNLYVNDTLYTTVAANKPRLDLNREEIGIPGNHGFAFTIPSDIVTNITAKVEARAVMLDGTETPIGTRYFITVKTGRAHTTLTAESVLASTNETTEKVSVSTNENGDFTAWNLPAGETYSVRASTTDFDVCFEPSRRLVTTTGIINDGDVTFTEITCPPPAKLRDELIKAWGPISWEREPGVTAVTALGPNFDSWLNSVLLFAATTGYKIKAIPDPFGHRGLPDDDDLNIGGDTGYKYRSYWTLILIFHDEQGYAQATGWYSRYLDVQGGGKPFSGIAPFIPRIPVEPGTAGTAVLPLNITSTDVAQVDDDLFQELPLLVISPEARLPVKWDVLKNEAAQEGINPITSLDDANAIEDKLYENLSSPLAPDRNLPLEVTRPFAWESAIANFHFGEKGCSPESYRCEVFKTFPSGGSGNFRTLRVRIPWPGKVTDDNVNVDWVRYNPSEGFLTVAYRITTSIFEGTVLGLATSGVISGLTSEITTALPQAVRYRSAIDLVLNNIINDGVDPEVALKAGFRRALGIGVGSVLDGIVKTTSGAVTINGQPLGKRIPFLAQLNFEDNFRFESGGTVGFNVGDGFQITQEGLEVDAKTQLNKLIGSDMLNLLNEAGTNNDSVFISSLKENVRELVTEKAVESFSTQQAGISKSLDILLVTSTKDNGENENIPGCIPSNDNHIEDEIECLFAAIVVGTEDEFRVSDLTPQTTDILRISAPDINQNNTSGPSLEDLYFTFDISLPHFATDVSNAGLNVDPANLIFTAFIDGKEIEDANPADTSMIKYIVNPDEVRMAGTHYLQVQVHTKDGDLKGDLVAESARLWFYFRQPGFPTDARFFEYHQEGGAIKNKVSE